MANAIKVSLLGSETLLGREVRDVAALAAPELQLRLIAAEEEAAGLLTVVGDEPALVTPLDAEAFSEADTVILAGSEASSRKALELWDNEGGGAIIDLTYAAEDHPEARLRAPILQAGEEASDISVIAHPAAIALAPFFRRLHANDAIRQAVVQVFAPASELGKAGVEELQEQTINLLSFKGLPKKVFDAQLSFNMLARYGEEASARLEEAELRIEKHLVTLLAAPGEGEGAPMPSLRLVQAPVFHGYTFSAWVEFEANPGVEAIENGLASEWISVHGPETEPPTNVGQAGQSGIAVGAVSEDRNNADACWFWFVADNFRLAAENAVAAARLRE